MEFQLLGPVEALVAGQEVDLGPPRQRCILAVLLVAAGQEVSVEALRERVWDSKQPTEETLHGYVTRLRFALAKADPQVRLLHPRGGAFRLTIAPEKVDYHRCQRLIRAAKAAYTTDEKALELLETALSMRAGVALSGLSGRWVDNIRASLDQTYYTATLDRFDIALRLSRHSEIVDEIIELAARYPLDERLAGQKILALYSDGRYAEALESYQTTRRCLLTDLGAEPGQPLQQLHRQVLRRDTGPPLLGARTSPKATEPRAVRREAASADSVMSVFHERIRRTAGRPFDFCSISAQNLDVVHQVETIGPDHEEDVREPLECPGGSGANTSIALAKLGLRVGIVGAVGGDRYGKLLRADFARRRIDTTYLLDIDEFGGTGHALVFTDRDGHRLIYVYPGVNEAFAEAINQRGLLDRIANYAQSARVLHLSSFTGTAERQAQEALVERLDRDTILSFSPGTLYARLGADQLSVLLARANLIFLYEQQLDLLLARSSAGGKGTQELPDKLGRLYEWRSGRGSCEPLVTVIKRPVELTRGRTQNYFSVGYGGDKLKDLGGPETGAHRIRIDDSTGAGDALVAGFLFGLVNYRTPRECVNVALAMALIVSRGVGARASLPTLVQLVSEWPHYLRGSAPAWLSADKLPAQ